MTIFVCLLLGGSMPILYFIGMIAIAFQYLCDRLTLAYFYRLPPMYTERLTIGTLELASFVPLLGLSLLFWQYTNMQMFDNEIDTITTQDEVRLSHHSISSLRWSSLQPAQ